MLLNRYYKRIVLVPTLFAIGGFVVYLIYQRYTYKSEWLTAESFEPVFVAWFIIHCLIVCCLCLTVYLNRQRKIFTNTAWSSLSWFLLPMLYLGGLLYKAGKSLRSHDYGLDDDLLFLSVTLPYVAGLIITFIQFRRAMKTS
jgi:hypothetical protein